MDYRQDRAPNFTPTHTHEHGLATTGSIGRMDSAEGSGSYFTPTHTHKHGLATAGSIGRMDSAEGRGSYFTPTHTHKHGMATPGSVGRMDSAEGSGSCFTPTHTHEHSLATAGSIGRMDSAEGSRSCFTPTHTHEHGLATAGSIGRMDSAEGSGSCFTLTHTHEHGLATAGSIGRMDFAQDRARYFAQTHTEACDLAVAGNIGSMDSAQGRGPYVAPTHTDGSGLAAAHNIERMDSEQDNRAPNLQIKYLSNNGFGHLDGEEPVMRRSGSYSVINIDHFFEDRYNLMHPDSDVSDEAHGYSDGEVINPVGADGEMLSCLPMFENEDFDKLSQSSLTNSQAYSVVTNEELKTGMAAVRFDKRLPTQTRSNASMLQAHDKSSDSGIPDSNLSLKSDSSCMELKHDDLANALSSSQAAPPAVPYEPPLELNASNESNESVLKSVKRMPIKRHYNGPTHAEWMANKKDLRAKQILQKRQEEEAKRLKEIERKKSSQMAYDKWLQSKQMNKRLKDSQSAQAAQECCNQEREAQRQAKLEEWTRRKNEESRKKALEQRKLEELKCLLLKQREKNAQIAFERFYVKTHCAAKPVQLGQGWRSLQSTTAPLNVNPEQWQAIVTEKGGEAVDMGLSD